MLGSVTQAEERALFVDALTRAAAESGYTGVTIERVANYAGRPADDFFNHFVDLDHCLLGSLERFLERLQEEMDDAWVDAEGSWPGRMKASIQAGVNFIMELECASRVFLVEQSGPAATEMRFAAVDGIARKLRPARELYPVAAHYPEIMEETLVAGVVLVISGALLAETPAFPEKLSEELVELVLTPYIGRREAHRIAGE